MRSRLVKLVNYQTDADVSLSKKVNWKHHISTDNTLWWHWVAQMSANLGAKQCIFHSFPAPLETEEGEEGHWWGSSCIFSYF